jgi:hypothetical protein
MTGGFDRLNHRDSMTSLTTAMLGLNQPQLQQRQNKHIDALAGSLLFDWL